MHLYRLQARMVLDCLPFLANERADTFPIPLLAPVIMYDRLEGSEMCTRGHEMHGACIIHICVSASCQSCHTKSCLGRLMWKPDHSLPASQKRHGA